MSRTRAWRIGVMVTLALFVGASAPSASAAPAADEPSHAPFALRARKALTAEREGPGFIDDAVVIVADGRIQAIGPADEVEIPADMEVIDLGAQWVMPGMIDLHTHVAGSEFTNDINDMVLQTNEGLRASCAVIPGNAQSRRQLSSGVTTVLFIPGSGTNMGGAGVLLKTGLDTYEQMCVRDPGSLKIAQGDNPTRWGYGMGRALMNFHIRTTVRRGLAYARAREAAAAGNGTRERNIQYDVFAELAAKRTQISTHTQIYQLVMMSILMLKGEFGLDVYIDHGEWMAFRAAPLAQEMGVAAIVGPREIDTFTSSRFDTDGKILSVTGEYRARGLEQVGFNTDAPVVPGDQLPLQAAIGVRYGLDNSTMHAVRGLTIVPAQTAGIAHRVGSLEVGKDADIVVLSGDPADPRSGVDRVWIEGRLVYEGGEVRAW